MKKPKINRFESDFRQLLKTDGEHCSFCRAQFEHNCKTYGGYRATGKIAITSDCCRHKLANVRASGVFVMQSSDLMPEVDDNGSKSLSLDEAARSVGALQKHFHHLDEMSGTMMKQAGLNTKAHRVHLKNYPWKADDAAWFQAHPDRSHRLRPMFDGELDSMSTGTVTLTCAQMRVDV
ncbi:hypothetical protein NJB93_21260 [Brucella intermedia]|uniref:hypothetical protein n=1 Tax=Brucella intermedia TaxID=94625 RepID=UPI00209AEE90|nr:hypothetical protein [Brucella intermedia]MCO7729076.1 hypothetical protein [Brucella intermedia]